MFCKSRLLIPGILLLLWACTSQPPEPVTAKIASGNRPEWLSRSFNDENWESGNGTTHKGISTLRFHIGLRSDSLNPMVRGVRIIALGAFDAYWDDRYIGSGGRVGNSPGEEIPGKHASVIPLPDSLVKTGEHLLALRVSNYHYQRNYAFFNVRTGPYTDLLTRPFRMGGLMAVLAGFFIIGALYYTFMFLQHSGEKLYLVFSVLCLLFLCLLLVEYLPLIWSYPYPMQVIRLELIGLLGLGIAFLIPYFLNRQLNSFDPLKFNGSVGMLLLGVFGWFHGRYDLTSQVLGMVMALAALAVSAKAVWTKIPGSRVVFTAIILGATAAIVLYYDYGLYIGFGLLLIAMLYLLSRRAKATEQAYIQAMLVSERLKTQLLKKSIQPHFLLNTLTCLTELIEQSPKAGVKLIIALGGEFDLFSRMAEQKLVPIGQELELCRYHLQVMQLRQNADYVLETADIDPAESIPPAVLHTLIENGITHSISPVSGPVIFTLKYTRTATRKTYQLEVKALPRRPKSDAEGTGTAYIKARLKENYGDAWKLESAAVPEGWSSTITLYT